MKYHLIIALTLKIRNDIVHDVLEQLLWLSSRDNESTGNDGITRVHIGLLTFYDVLEQLLWLSSRDYESTGNDGITRVHIGLLTLYDILEQLLR